MMATVPHVTCGSGLRKFQAGGFLFDRVYKDICTPTVLSFFIFSKCLKIEYLRTLTILALLYVFAVVFIMRHVLYGWFCTQSSSSVWVPQRKAKIITERANRVSHYTAQTEQLSNV